MKFKYKLSTMLVVLLILIILSFAVLDFTPDLVRVFNLKQKLNQQQDSFEVLQQDLQSKKSLLDSKLEGELAPEELLEAIPYQMKTNQFLKQLKELISKSKLKLNRYVPQEVIEKQDYFKLPILLEITGDYEDLNSFFKELEETTRLVTVERVKIFNDQEQLKSEVLLAIYSLAEARAGDKK